MSWLAPDFMFAPALWAIVVEWLGKRLVAPDQSPGEGTAEIEVQLSGEFVVPFEELLLGDVRFPRKNRHVELIPVAMIEGLASHHRIEFGLEQIGVDRSHF